MAGGDDFFSFLSGYLLGIFEARRRPREVPSDAGRPTRVERGTVLLLRRLFSRQARAAHATAKAERLILLREEAARRRRDRARVRRVKASARRRMLRKATRIAVVLVILVIGLAIVGLFTSKPPSSAHGTITIRQRF